MTNKSIEGTQTNNHQKMNLSPKESDIIYERRAHYHETDQMGIVHHSNFIKWFEEARIHLMKEIGTSYKIMEEEGVISPVVNVFCEYKTMVRFDDEVFIHIKIIDYNSIAFKVKYRLTNEDESISYAIGESKHCFLSKEMRIIALKKSHPHINEIFMAEFTKNY